MESSGSSRSSSPRDDRNLDAIGRSARSARPVRDIRQKLDQRQEVAEQESLASISFKKHCKWLPELQALNQLGDSQRAQLPAAAATVERKTDDAGRSELEQAKKQFKEFILAKQKSIWKTLEKQKPDDLIDLGTQHCKSPISEYSEEELGTKTSVIFGRGKKLDYHNSEYRDFLLQYKKPYNELNKNKRNLLLDGIIQHLLNNSVIFQQYSKEGSINITDRKAIKTKIYLFFNDVKKQELKTEDEPEREAIAIQYTPVQGQFDWKTLEQPKYSDLVYLGKQCCNYLIPAHSEELGKKTYVTFRHNVPLKSYIPEFRNFLLQYIEPYNDLDYGKKPLLLHGIIQHLLNNGVIFQQYSKEGSINITDRGVIIEKIHRVFINEKKQEAKAKAEAETEDEDYNPPAKRYKTTGEDSE